MRNLYPLRMVYLRDASLPTHQVLVTVPRRVVSSAVSRNKLKRRVREAYRLHKNLLTDSGKAYFAIGYIYIGPSKPCSFITIRKQVTFSLRYLNQLPIQDHHDTPST